MTPPNEKALTSEVVDMLRNGYDELNVTLFLRDQGLEPDAAKLILEKALEERLQEKLTYLPQRNKRIFWGIVAITVLMMWLVFFVWPSADRIGYSTMLSIVGAALLMCCLNFLVLYYKSWTPEFLKHRDSPRTNFTLLPLFLVPGVIVYFIMSSIFDSKAKQELAANMERTKGVIVDGHSYASRRFDFTAITVQFETKAGKSFTVEKDISKYNFKEFYKGQTVDVLYSRTNPNIIEILTEGMDARDVTKSEERDITVKDLLALIGAEPRSVAARLDKITFGWQYDSTQQSWSNERKKLFLQLDRSSLTFRTLASTGLLLPRQLQENGFTRSGAAPSTPFPQAPQKFTNGQWSAVVEMNVIGNMTAHTLVLSKN